MNEKKCSIHNKSIKICVKPIGLKFLKAMIDGWLAHLGLIKYKHLLIVYMSTHTHTSSSLNSAAGGFKTIIITTPSDFVIRLNGFTYHLNWTHSCAISRIKVFLFQQQFKTRWIHVKPNKECHNYYYYILVLLFILLLVNRSSFTGCKRFIIFYYKYLQFKNKIYKN